MTKIVPIQGSADTTVVKTSIVASPSSAGAILPYNNISSSAVIFNTSATAGFEYKVNDGAWNFVGRNGGANITINFYFDTLYLRQTANDTSATTAEISIDSDPLVTIGTIQTDTAASPAAEIMLLGNENFAAVSLGASDFIMDLQVPAIGAFYGVKLKYANYDTTAVMTIDGAKVAACPTHTTTAGNTLTWSAFVTSGGLQTLTVPQAKTGPGGRIIPGILITDYVAVTSIPRTDTVGAPFLLRVRSHVLANAKVYTAGGAYALPLNNAAYNPGLLYSNYNFNDTLANLTTATSGTLNPSGPMEPVGVTFFYSSPVETIAVFGDSILQGAADEISNFAGFTTRATFLAYGTGRKLVGANYAQSGQTTYDSISTMKAHILAGYRPTYCAIKPWSINDGSTAAIVNSSWAQFVEALEFLRTNGIKPIAITSSPTNNQPNSALWGFVKVLNARVMALPNWVIKVDFASVVNNPAQDGVMLPQYNSGDYTHPVGAAHLILAKLVLAATI